MDKVEILSDEIINYIIQWYPHIGNAVSKDLNLPPRAHEKIVRKYNLKVLPKHQRLCIICRTNMVYIKSPDTKTEYGNKCMNCYYARHRFYHARRMSKNPLLTRLKANLKSDIKNAIKKQLKVDITVQDLIEKYHQQNGMCYYTGIKMTCSPIMRGRGRWDYDSVSIDRKIPSLGYTKDNVVLCCFWANTAKLDMSYETLVNKCEQIVSYARKEHENKSRES